MSRWKMCTGRRKIRRIAGATPNQHPKPCRQEKSYFEVHQQLLSAQNFVFPDGLHSCARAQQHTIRSRRPTQTLHHTTQDLGIIRVHKTQGRSGSKLLLPPYTGDSVMPGVLFIPCPSCACSARLSERDCHRHPRQRGTPQRGLSPGPLSLTKPSAGRTSGRSGLSPGAGNEHVYPTGHVRERAYGASGEKERGREGQRERERRERERTASGNVSCVQFILTWEDKASGTMYPCTWRV